MQQKNIYFEKCNKALEERIMRLEQKELEMQIELINVQKQEGENLMATVGKIAQELRLKTEDIEKVWRRPSGPTTKEPRPVIVSMRSREARSDWLKCKKNPISNNILFNNGNQARIYINENLTRQMRQLFWSVKTKLKETYKYIWIQNGRILIRRNESEKKVYQINFESDIEAFIDQTQE